MGVVLLVAVGLAVIGWMRGDRLYAVQTGSMTPNYGIGSLVITEPPPAQVVVGDVVTFHPHRNNDEVVTHRVYSVHGDTIVTKGDANAVPDTFDLTTSSVVGKVLYGVPHLGYVLIYLQQPTGAASWAVAIIGMVMLWQLFFPTAEPAEPAQPARVRRRARRAFARAEAFALEDEQWFDWVKAHPEVSAVYALAA